MRGFRDRGPRRHSRNYVEQSDRVKAGQGVPLGRRSRGATGNADLSSSGKLPHVAGRTALDPHIRAGVPIEKAQDQTPAAGLFDTGERTGHEKADNDPSDELLKQGTKQHQKDKGACLIRVPHEDHGRIIQVARDHVTFHLHA